MVPAGGKLIVETKSMKRPLLTETPLTYAKVVLRFITSFNRCQDQASSATGSVWLSFKGVIPEPRALTGGTRYLARRISSGPTLAFICTPKPVPPLKIVGNSTAYGLLQQNSDQHE
jgi:hypothetical protein